MPPPLLLALDTTNTHGSLALARGSELFEQVDLVSPDGFSGILFGAITGLLERHGVKLSDVEAFASAAGPGSFTGVRVGLTAAKGLAEMNGRTVVPISNLAAVAYSGKSHLTPEVRFLAPVLDLRRGQIAGAVYSSDLGVRLPPLLAAPDAFAARAAEFGQVFYCGPDAPRFFPSAAHCAATPRALAGAIALLAAAELASGRGLDPAAAEADYVRRPDIRNP